MSANIHSAEQPWGDGALAGASAWGAGPGHGLSLVAPHRKPPLYRRPEEIENAVAEMRELRERGQLDSESRAPIAKRLHVTDRTLRNWLQAADRKDPIGAGAAPGQVGRPRFVLSEADIDARAGFTSDADWHLWLLAKAAAENKKASQRNGVPTIVMPEVHRTTALRALRRQAPANLVAGLRGGEKAVASHSARFDVDHPLGDTWQGDLSYLPVLTRLREGGRAFQPVWLAFREPHSGRIMAEALLPHRPDAAMVAAVIGQGLLTTALPDGTELLPPRQIRLDNAAEHVSAELTERLAGTGISVSLNTDSYASWQNGAIERFWGMAKKEAVSRVPGNRLLGLTRSGRHYTLPGGDAVAFDDLQAFLSEEFIPYFNTARHSEARGGRVPDQVWADEVAAVLETRRVRRPREALVAQLALPPRDAARTTQKVSNTGVRIGARYLSGAAVTDKVGLQVQVRRWPNRSVAIAEVFDRDGRTYLGRVRPHALITEEERRAVRCAERATRDRVRGAKHMAMHRYGAQFGLIQGPNDGHTGPFAAGEYSGWQPGETAAEADSFDREHAHAGHGVADTMPRPSARPTPRARPTATDSTLVTDLPVGADWLFDDGEGS